jgi:hypothetical protein
VARPAIESADTQPGEESPSSPTQKPPTAYRSLSGMAVLCGYVHAWPGSTLNLIQARGRAMFNVGNHVRARRDVKMKGLPQGMRAVTAHSNGTVVAVQQPFFGGASCTIAFTLSVSAFPVLAFLQREADWELVLEP